MSARELGGCQWPGIEHPLYTHYHDTEWGVPKLRDVELFEKLILEGFQAGLSWLTILRKRDNFRDAFHAFDPERLASFTESDVSKLMRNDGIIRNRLKIEASVQNAQSYIALRERTTLAKFLFAQLKSGPICNQFAAHGDIPGKTSLSESVSKALRREGFRFVGPTTTYAYMQSIGMVNDHLTGCARHKVCAKLQCDYDPQSVY